MADLQRKTANLFDKDNTTIYNAYLAVDSESSIWITSEDSRSVKMPCKPNTQYTLSISSAIPIFRICSSSNANIEPSGGGVRVRTIIRSENIQQYTFTTSANDVCIIFQGSASLVNEWFNSLMLNEGSTALPYEPYWQHSLRKLTTATDTITTLPAVVYADGTNATVGLVGNMVQTGTPSPQNPIQPSETGERTGNLYNYQTVVIGKYINAEGEETPSAGVGDNLMNHTDYISITSGESYYFKIRKTYDAGASSNAFCWFDSNKNLISRDLFDMGYNNYIYATYTAPQNAAYLIVNFRGEYYGTGMLNIGDTAAEFEPYGYKLTISSANTTTPVYLGEVESTRNIKKYEFTGSETWNVGSENFYSFVPETSGDGVPYSSVICSHCSGSTINNTGKAVFIKKSELPNITTGAELKQYCLEQYAAGTPVTVWYVLATPETAVVNEPIRKIGTYADTVSGITIPTITGKDTVDVETTLKPSEVSLAYTGWHDANVKEKSENLYDYTFTSGYNLDTSTGIPTTYGNQSRMATLTPINISAYDSVVFNFTNTTTNTLYAMYSTIKNGTLVNRVANIQPPFIVDVSNADEIYFCIYNVSSVDAISNDSITNVMLNTGSTALPYEPYWK